MGCSSSSDGGGDEAPPRRPAALPPPVAVRPGDGEWEQRSFASPHGDMCYLRLPPAAGAPRTRAVLMLHGMGGDGYSFDQPHARCLRGLGVVLAPDLLGNGASACPAGDAAYSMRAQGRAAAALLRHEGVADVCVVAHSMGGPVAVAAAEECIASGMVRVLRVLYAEPNVDAGDCFASRAELARLSALAPPLLAPATSAALATCRDLVRESDSGELPGRMRGVAAAAASLVLVGEQNSGKLSSEEAVRGAGLPVRVLPAAAHGMHADNAEGFYAMATAFFVSGQPP